MMHSTQSGSICLSYLLYKDQYKLVSLFFSTSITISEHTIFHILDVAYVCCGSLYLVTICGKKEIISTDSFDLKTLMIDQSRRKSSDWLT